MFTPFTKWLGLPEVLEFSSTDSTPRRSSTESQQSFNSFAPSQKPQHPSGSPQDHRLPKRAHQNHHHHRIFSPGALLSPSPLNWYRPPTRSARTFDHLNRRVEQQRTEPMLPFMKTPNPPTGAAPPSHFTKNTAALPTMATSSVRETLFSTTTSPMPSQSEVLPAYRMHQPPQRGSLPACPDIIAPSHTPMTTTKVTIRTSATTAVNGGTLMLGSSSGLPATAQVSVPTNVIHFSETTANVTPLPPPSLQQPPMIPKPTLAAGTATYTAYGPRSDTPTTTCAPPSSFPPTGAVLTSVTTPHTTAEPLNINIIKLEKPATPPAPPANGSGETPATTSVPIKTETGEPRRLTGKAQKAKQQQTPAISSDGRRQLAPVSVQSGSANRLGTSPSPAVSLTTDSAEIRVQTRLNRLKKSIASLEMSVQAEYVDLAAYDAAVRQSQLILHDVTHNLRTSRELIHARTEQLEDANKRIRILMAEDLADCTLQNLEDISDVLWSGLQAATLALSRRQDSAQTGGAASPSSSTKLLLENAASEVGLHFVSSTVPEAKFEPAPTPSLTVEGTKAEDLCLQLIDILQAIRDIQKKSSREQKSLQAKLQQLQKQIQTTNSEYNSERTNLLNLEKKLDTRFRQVNRMTGRDSYESLTVTQLAELCKTINKASRRLATEQAIREVRAQQQALNDDPSSASTSPPTGLPPPVDHPERCLVCFERNWNRILDPCEHMLCEECAERLKYCPQCRQKVQGSTPVPPPTESNDAPPCEQPKTMEQPKASESSPGTKDH